MTFRDDRDTGRHAGCTHVKKSQSHSFNIQRIERGFLLNAKTIVILPDHPHCVWKLSEDGDDFIHHANYVYINPVKRRHVALPIEWPYSSFDRDMKQGVFPENWAGCA
ncbi:MAG: hypothetical protein ABIP02_00705 [Arenimonas sp.]